jgi:hypothetical protein
MKEVNFGLVIAERVLKSSRVENDIVVKIGAPQKSESADYRTPYQILGIGDENVRFAAGLDAVQSLQLVFKMIGADLSYGFRLRWAETDESGFPVPQTFR